MDRLEANNQDTGPEKRTSKSSKNLHIVLKEHLKFFFSLFIVLILVFLIILVSFMTNKNGLSTEYFSSLNPHSFGSIKYECSGFCFCTSSDGSDERRISSSVHRGAKFVVLAITSILAIKSAEKFFEDDCKSHFSAAECPYESIESEVGECKEVVSNDFESSDSGVDMKDKTFELQPIGIIRSSYMNTTMMPKSQRTSRGSGGAVIEIFPEYVQGIQDLDGFSHVYVFFVFDRIDETMLLVHPMGNRKNKQRGVFATRAPVRPNSIGMSLVHIIKVEGNLIHIDGIDALNGTPVVDIKPYFGPESDEEVKTGWFGKS